MKVLTGVGAVIEGATHADRLTGVVHGHDWVVTAWHECKDENDAVVLRSNLELLCKGFDHKPLPPELTRAEDLAVAIMRLSPPSCVEVEISRAGRLYARVTA
jgi:hypothetical protein